MSKHRRPSRSGKPPVTPPGKPGIPGVTFILLAVVVVAAVTFWWWKSTHNDILPPAAPVSEAGAQPEFQKLEGKWLRPDGGYIIEIKNAQNAGKIDAAYFNPSPIHVARAQASLDGTAIRVFLELRDENYPGSTYTLRYDPKSDQLDGIYYQALQQQSYEVTFLRMESK